ncbi:MAG: restriction endonuclease subunit S [Candidatus Omnitrophota bacterium]|nr:restriction endonuclease subunit S [Candidatus Omnitrophota bacterium]
MSLLGSEKTELRPLPVGWRWVRLGEVCEIIAGQSPPGETYRKRPEGLPFFQGKADFGTRHPVPSTWCLSPTKIAEPGDILISVRAPVGPTNVADVKCCIGRGLAAVRPGNMAEREFILAALRLYEPHLASLGSGSTFSAIKREDIESLEIPLPPIAEQQRIAAILGEQLAAVARARSATEAELEAAEALPATYLRAVFNSPDAQRWPRTRLGEVICQRQEIVHPHDRPNGRATFVGLEHIEPATGHRMGSLDVEMSELTGRKPRFYKGNIVYGYLRPYLNKLWVAEFDGLCSVDQYVYVVDPKKADTFFIASFMRSPVYLERAPVGVTPGYLPRIRTEEVASVEFNVPPLPEQRRITAKLSEQEASAERLRQTLTEQLDAVNTLPAALLRRAFSGEL